MDPDQADFVLARAGEAEAELTGPRVADRLDRLEVERDRIADALGWFLEP